MKRFEVLRICKDGIKDDDLKIIASLPNIKLLELKADTGYEDAPICKDRCAGYLSRGKTLRTVIIHDRKWTDKFVEKLTRGLPSLEMLAIGSPDFTNESLRLISECYKKLERLDVSSDRFTSDGVKHLNEMKNLTGRFVGSKALQEK